MTHVLDLYAQRTMDAAAPPKPLPDDPKPPHKTPSIAEDAPECEDYVEIYRLMRSKMMQSVCKEVGCPNFRRCWGK